MIRFLALLAVREGKIYPILTVVALIDIDLVVQEIVFPGHLYALLDFSCNFFRTFLFKLLRAGGLRCLSLASIDGGLPRRLLCGLTQLLVKELKGLFLLPDFDRVRLCLKP